MLLLPPPFGVAWRRRKLLPPPPLTSLRVAQPSGQMLCKGLSLMCLVILVEANQAAVGGTKPVVAEVDAAASSMP